MRPRYNIVWTDEKVEKTIKVLTRYFEEYGVGECIMQSDESLIEAPEILSQIADEILIEDEGIVYADK